MRVIYLKPIKNLETVHVGVAEFEEKAREFVEAGGEGFSNPSSFKSDLLAILPAELRRDLQGVRMATERTAGFDAFRDSSCRSLQGCSLSRDAARLSTPPSILLSTATMALVKTKTSSATIAKAISWAHPTDSSLRKTGKAANRNPKSPGGARRPRQAQAASGDRPPSRCANCSKTHDGPCKERRKELTDRTCWTCGSKLHMNKDCPKN